MKERKISTIYKLLVALSLLAGILLNVMNTTSVTAEAPDGVHFITGGDGVTGAIVLNFLGEGKEGGSHYNTLYRLTEYQTVDGYELNTT